jgi:hypothetical protein
VCDRTLVEMQVLPGQEADGLIPKLHALRQQIDPNVSGALNETSFESRTGAVLGLENVSSCEVCKAVMGKTMKFLARYQYDLSTQPRSQEHHAGDGGFCPLHTWHYEQIASPRGVCTAYPALLNQLAGRLRYLATNGTQEPNYQLQVRETQS